MRSPQHSQSSTTAVTVLRRIILVIDLRALFIILLKKCAVQLAFMNRLFSVVVGCLSKDKKAISKQCLKLFKVNVCLFILIIIG